MNSQRLNELESQGDWRGLAAALTACIDETSDANEQAELHSRLGHVLAGKLLQAPVALKHFQTAWKLRPASGGPLRAASHIYWELGKIRMVEMVLRKALECTEGIDRGEVLMEIGAACCDQAKYEEAKTAYETAAEEDNALEDDALALMVDLSSTEEDYEERCDELKAEAAEASGTAATAPLLRAARIAARYDEDLFEEFALAAYRADCCSRQAAAVYEEYLLKKDRLAEVLNEQRNVLGDASVADGARIAFAFGTRWVTRHQNLDIGGRLLETAVLGDPENDVAFTFLKTQWGEEAGEWDRILKLAEQAAERVAAPFILAQAGTIAWLKLDDQERARHWFERLASVDAQNAELRKFEDEIGRRLSLVPPSEPDDEEPPQSVLDVASVDVVMDDEAIVSIGTEELESDMEALRDLDGGEGHTVPMVSSEADDGAADDGAAADGQEVEDGDEVDDVEVDDVEVDDVEVDDVEVDVDEVDVDEVDEVAPAPPPMPTAIAADDAAGDVATDDDEDASEAASDDDDASGDEDASEAASDEDGVDDDDAEDADVEDASPEAPAVEATPSPVPVTPTPGPAAAGVPTEQDDAAIAALLEEAAQQEKARRNHDYVKTLVKVAQAYADVDKRVEYFAKAATVYQKFSNATEAAKCFEALLDVRPSHAEATTFLRGYYEKRRDWAKLMVLMRRDADALDEAERRDKYVELAELATTKIKKPEICIELWTEVQQLDPHNEKALGSLVMFYERAREWDKLAEVLSQQVEVIDTPAEQAKLLTKLAQIHGDRRKDDDQAADAWGRVLEIDPSDRRAQENLKKKLIALHRWDDLEGLFEQSGKWDEFIRLLESQESREKDVEVKVGLLTKVADLWQTKKGKSDRASRAYEKILNLDSDNLQAAEALVPMYTEADNPKGLATALEVTLRHTEDGDSCLEQLRQLGELYETKLRKPDEALERFLSALSLDPMSAPDAESAERVAGKLNAWDKLVIAYRGALDKIEDLAAQVTLRLRLGRVLLDELDMLDEALEQYGRVYELDPNCNDALSALQRLYHQAGRHADLLGVYERQLNLLTAPDQPRDSELLCKVLGGMAELYEGALDDAASAVDTYWKVLDIDPDATSALEALDRLYLKDENWARYAEVLRRQLEMILDEPKMIDLKLRLGRTLQAHLEDAAAAFECYREILSLDPNHDAGRSALEGLLDNEDMRGDAAGILADVYEARSESAALIKALDILVDVSDSVVERVDLLTKLGAVAADQVEDLEVAVDAQSRALRQAPERDDVRTILEAYVARAEQEGALAGVYESIAKDTTDGQLARDYWMRVAQLRRALGEIDVAASAYEQALEVDPADAEALDGIESLFQEAERHESLVGVLRRRIEQANDDEAREALFIQMAKVFSEDMDQADNAISAYCEVLVFNEASELALTALDRLYTAQGLFEQLADNLESQLRFAETAETRVSFLLRLAGVQENKLSQVEAAIETCRTVLEIDVENAAAMAVLERIGQDENFDLAIAEVLAPLYRQSGDISKLLGTYEVQIKRSDDLGRRVELLHEMTMLHEEASGDLGAAFETMARAVSVDPASERSREQLERLGRAGARHEDLAGVYERLAAAQGDDIEMAVSLYTASALVCEHDLDNVDRAIAHYQTILGIDEQHVASAEALERIYRGADRYADLSQVLQEKAGMMTDPSEQTTALMQAAQIEEELLERNEQAIAVYIKALELDGENLAAIDALIRLYLAAENWTALLGSYNQKVDLVFDPDERKRIYYQMGAVYEREIGQVSEAIDTYQRVLEIDPDDIEALGRLDVLYQQAGNYPELLNVLQRESELAADPAESASYGFRIAQLYDTELDDVMRAIDLYRDLLLQQAEHPPTIEALDAIAKSTRESIQPAQAIAAAQVLEPVYEAASAWTSLIDTLEVQSLHSDDRYLQVDLLQRVARTWEEMVGDEGAAFAVYSRALALDSSNEESFAHCERLAAICGRWAEVAALYGRQLDALGEDPSRFVEVATRLGVIYEEQLADYQNAVIAHQRVLEVEPESMAALASLDRLFTVTERWSELVGALARQAELSADGEMIVALKYRLATVRQDKLNELADAIATYGEILQAAPDHQESIQALEALFAHGTEALSVAAILDTHYDSIADYPRLVQVVEVVLANTTEPAERIQLYYRLAELQETQLYNAEVALSVYARAMQEFPGDDRCLDDAERLAASVELRYDQAGNALPNGWEQLANAYADALGGHESPEIQCLIGKRLARVFEEEIQDAEKAIQTYQYVLGVVPLEAACLEQLDRLYTDRQQFAELAEVLEQRAGAAEEAYAQIEFHQRLGEIYETALQQVDDAIRIYRKLFEELDTESDDPGAALERLFLSQARYNDLYGVYETQLTRAPGDHERAETYAKMGRLLGEHLGDAARAVSTWKHVLELRGEDGEALGALSELYERTEQWGELTEILERHLANVYDDQEQVAVLHRRARLYATQLGREDSALEDYGRILDIDYANVDALYAINDIWRRRENAQELSYAIHQTVDRVGESLPAEHQVSLYRELAGLHQAVEGEAFEAIECWRKLIAIDGKDFDAMAQLESLLRNEDRWDEVAALKTARAEAFDDVAEKLREYLEVAHVWEHQVGNEDGATPALEEVIELDPTNQDAFDQLEKLHIAADRHEDLVALYLDRVEVVGEVRDKTRLLRKVARVLSDKLGQKEPAYEALETALSLDYRDEDTIEYIEELAAETKRWAALVQVVNQWLESATAQKTKVALCLLLAKWYGEHLDRPDYAQPYYAQVTELDPNNVQALRQQASFLKKNAQFQQAGRLLTQAEQAASQREKAAIQTDIGELLAKHMDESDKAVVYYERALDNDPFYLRALEALEGMYEQRNKTEALEDVLGRMAKAMSEKDDPRLADVTLRRAGILESVLGKPTEAIEVYRAVLDVEAGNLLAIRGLERVYVATQKWPELLEVLEMHLDVVQTERERVDVLMQIAGLYEEQFLKHAQAATRLEQVVETDPMNEQAFSALGRCYHHERRWLDLVGVYERHINATDERAMKVTLYENIASVFAEHIQDHERALDAYLNVVELDPQHVSALEALARLYDRMEDPGSAIDYMTRVAELTVDGGKRVEAFYQIGRQLEEKLKDRYQARERFEQALDLDPTHVPTLSALRSIAIDEADWTGAARHLDTEQQQTESPRAKAKLLAELGQLRAQYLDDEEGANAAYQAALEADPENEDAALPLVRSYVASESWEAAEPLAAVLMVKAARKERAEQVDLYLLAGTVSYKLEKYADALKAYQAAVQADMSNHDAIYGLAESSFQIKDWPSALTSYQRVLTGLEEDDTERRAQVYCQLGLVKQQQGQARQAISNFAKALGIEPSHRLTLDSLISVHESQGDYVQACAYRQQLIDGVIDGDERFALLLDLGDLWADRAGDAQQAIAAFEQAADLQPNDHKLLHKMIALYQKTSQWDRLVDVLRRVAEADADLMRRSRYLFTMAQVYRDKLDDPYHAAELFDESLDLNPGYIDAFKRIDQIYTKLKDWGRLERSYRKMIHRIHDKGKQELEFSLWHALGLIYRDRLQDIDKARDAFKVAVALRPEAIEEHLILGEIEQNAGKFDEALGSYRSLLQHDQMNVDAYRAMYTVYLQKQTYDEAWCVASVLAFLSRANEGEQQFFADWRPTGRPQVTARLDDAIWKRCLTHPTQDSNISAIFAAVADAALKAKIAVDAAGGKAPVLPPQARQDRESSSVSFCQTFWWAGEVLGIASVPELYARNDVPGGLTAVAAQPHASVAGQGVLQGLGELELAFVAGKHLAMYRPEHYIKTQFKTVSELTVLLFAAIRMVAPQTPAPQEFAGQVQATTQSLASHVQPIQREHLKVAVKKFLAEGARANIKRWAQAVETTAARAGLLLAGDLDVAKRIIASETAIPGDLSAQERLKDLMLFTVSTDHIELREALGIRIEAGQ